MVSQGAFLGCNLTVRGAGSEIQGGSSASFAGRNGLIADGGRLSATEIDLGLAFIDSDLLITGPGSSMEGQTVYMFKGEPFREPSARLSLLVADGANLTAHAFLIGPDAPKATNVFTLDGGNATVDSLLLDNGSVTIRHGIFRAGALEIVGTNASINASGSIVVGSADAPVDGQFKVGQITLDTKGRLAAASAVNLASGSDLVVRASAPTSNALLSASGAITLNGKLEIALGASHTLQPGNSIVLMTAPAITGQFNNIAAGQRIFTTDGSGSFLLSVTADTVTLSNFQPFAVTASFDAAASKITLTFPTGSATKIQTSINLADWTDVPSPDFQISGDQTSWSTPIDLAQGRRFYRLLRASQ